MDGASGLTRAEQSSVWASQSALQAVRGWLGGRGRMISVCSELVMNSQITNHRVGQGLPCCAWA